MKTKILDKKHIIVFAIAILSIIVSYFNVTYAYFDASKKEEISIRSAASFGEATVYNFNDMLEGNLTYTSNKSEMLKITTTSFKKDNVEANDYLLTVATQVKPHDTLYELDEYTNISYEIYHKTDLSIDTSTFTCTDNNTYNNGTSDDYCNTGTFIENSLEGTPFELIKDFRISDTDMHYFDVYIYLNNDVEIDSEETITFRTNIFFLDKETEKEKKEKTLEEVKTFISNNVPDLNTGLIPVVYDENGTSSKWFVADTSKAWYDYESQWWANAVSVDSITEGIRTKYVNDDGTYKSGTEIAEADMLAMFVWIPRYSYTIGCTDIDLDGTINTELNAECLGYKVAEASDLATKTPGAIDIKFVSIDKTDILDFDNGYYPIYEYTSPNSRTPSNWYTPPAFWWDDNNDSVRATDGSEELLGIWVGKFETSVNQESVCYDDIINKNDLVSDNCLASNLDVTPRILPNVPSLVYQNIYNQFETTKKFSNNNIYGLTGDSHMMKNSEWAAAAYLSQSIYGKYGNTDYSNANKEIYKNNSRGVGWAGYTGRSQGFSPAVIDESVYGTYEYDGKSTSTDGEDCMLCGTGASTTGNIFGIYDMNGGVYEYIMGNYMDNVGNSELDFNEFKSIYYDKFTVDKPYAVKNKETVGKALYEVAEWYNDAGASFSSSFKLFWFINGGSASTNEITGIFGASMRNGGSISSSFRSVLVTAN